MAQRVFVTGLGLVSPAGAGVDAHRRLLLNGERRLRPLSLFPVPNEPLPAGEVSIELPRKELPRTHRLALAAACEAIGDGPPPDLVILGGTTGGIPHTERLLKEGARDPAGYALHGTGTVASWLAEELRCPGGAMTVSTACSGGAVALALARRMLLAGEASRILAGGVDALCRLTYHGFRLLQLIDPLGTRPLDRDRAGMSVGEAAALLLLTVGDDPPTEARATLLGAGLSCDAYHPSAPHPDGAGALAAMQGALDDAGLPADLVGYVNLHGTGTRDNDASEARALHTLFPQGPPPLSSTKGSLGHPLAAAGALEAGLAVLCLEDGILPASVGCCVPDPVLALEPLEAPRRADPGLVLSNSFGFGGNNASLLLGGRNDAGRSDAPHGVPRPLRILGASFLTGKGHVKESMARLARGDCVAGKADDATMIRDLPPRSLRRMKRLSRMSLALGAAALEDAGGEPAPHGICVGTGWGSLSETCDFLDGLFRSREEFSSPTDFVGSVHNAVASHLAIRFGARGPNLTATDGDVSFVEAAWMAALLGEERPVLLCGADEHHPLLSPLLDPSVAAASHASDGGGALLVRPGRSDEGGPVLVAHRPYPICEGPEPLLKRLGAPDEMRTRFAAVFLDIPAAQSDACRSEVERFLCAAEFDGPVLPVREFLGDYATVSAAATALAALLLRDGELPPAMGDGEPHSLKSKGILVLGVGRCWSALELLP